MVSRNNRQAFLDDLTSVIAKEREYVQGILNKLQWNEEQIMEGTSMVQCPVNINHQILESSLAKHTATCRLAQEGYSQEDQAEMTNNDWFYANTKTVHSISIDQSTQNQILTQVSGPSGIKPVPKTVDRRERDLTSEERLAIYEYVVQKAKEQGSAAAVPLEDLAFDPTSTGQKDKKNAETIAAMKAKQRDLKRRRQTYRAKNVHITRRSQTQIMKEIIDMQMSEIIDAYKDEEDNRRKEERRERREDRRERRDERRERRRDRRQDGDYVDGSGDERSARHERIEVKHEADEEGEVVESPVSRDQSRHSSRGRSPTHRSHRRDYDRSPDTRKRDYDRSPVSRRRDYDDSPSTRRRDYDRSPESRRREYDRSRDYHSPSERRTSSRYIKDKDRYRSHSREPSDHHRSPSVRRTSSKYNEDRYRSHSREPSVETTYSRQSSHDASTDRSDEEREKKHRKKKKKSEHKSRRKHKHKHSRDKVRIKEENSD